jgi:hypothetical protein
MIDATTINDPQRLIFSAPDFDGVFVVGVIKSFSLLMMFLSGFVFVSQAVWSIASATVSVKMRKLISFVSNSE